jgi:hypothetical protein
VIPVCLGCRPGSSGLPGRVGCTCPLVCICPVARPRPFPECNHCLRAVVGLWPAAHYLAAVRAYPSLLDQRIDWTLRHIRGRADGLDLEQLAQAGAA